MARKHSERTHAQWSASATERNWLCPGNIALLLDTVRVPESKAAAWGTASHQVAEHFLRHDEMLPTGTKVETERNVFYVDIEMQETVRVYTDYIRRRCTEGYDVYAIEQQFSLDSLELGMEAGGTADCVLYNPTTEDLEIVDLKTGKGHVVEAEGNPQERFYGVGVAVGMDLGPTPVSTVTTTIVQPRAQHVKGPIRSETIPLMDLIDWTIDLAKQVRTAAAALRLYSQARGSGVKMDAWVEQYLAPGEIQCTFCPAAGACPALRRKSLEITGAWEDDSGVHFKSNQFKENSVEDVEADLDMFETLEAWIRERKALAHEMARQGEKFDHHVLVEKIGHRKFTISDDEVIDELRTSLFASDEQIFDRKLKSPAGLERSLGKQVVADSLGDLIHRPVIGTDLIRSSQTDRSAVPTLDQFFIDPVDIEGESYGTGKHR